LFPGKAKLQDGLKGEKQNGEAPGKCYVGRK